MRTKRLQEPAGQSVVGPRESWIMVSQGGQVYNERLQDHYIISSHEACIDQPAFCCDFTLGDKHMALNVEEFAAYIILYA